MHENAKLIDRWRYCHELALFFTDFPVWLSKSGERDQAALLIEFDELFKGTRADIVIPLWASAVLNGGLLYDSVTLAVIKQYNAFGYEPVPMDGNPPDFIGQMLRFMCYLYACALSSDANSFAEAYLLKTISAVADGIRKHTATPLFIKIAERLERPYTPVDSMDFALPELNCYDAYLHGPSTPRPDMPPREIKTAGRNNCGGKCAVSVTVQQSCLTSLSAGCARGAMYRETFMNASRLRYPMKRVAGRGEGRFQRISWEEAADITAAEMMRIREKYGPAARYINYGTGVSAVLRPDSMAARLLNLDGGHLEYYNSYSSACARFTTPYIYGDVYSGNSIEDMPNTRLLILWGHNPAETVFGSEREFYLQRARKNGAYVVVIDPRRSDTAQKYADEWIGVRPSTDAALADGMAYVIWSEGLQEQAFMDCFCLGFDESHMPEDMPAGSSYQAYLFGWSDGVPKTPEWAEAVTGVPALTIARLARLYAGTKPACLLPGLGPQRTGCGEQAVRAMAMLACLTGNVGIPGGGAAGVGALPSRRYPKYPIPDNPYPGAIPSFLWTRSIENSAEMTARDDGLRGVDKLESPIKMIINMAGNTLINQHSDINKTIRILSDTSLCEFILCSDVFMTPSARFADLLLPATSMFEDDNMGTPWEYGEYLLCHNKAVDPLFECRFEYSFWEDVSHRMGLHAEWSAGYSDYREWLKALYEDTRLAEPELPDYDTFQREGGYLFKKRAPYIAYSKQITGEELFPTPSGKIEIFSRTHYDLGRPDEIPAIPKYVPCPEGYGDPLAARYPLQLIGWHTKRRTHTIGDNNTKLEKLEPQRLWINPIDAQARGLHDGDLAEVFNDRGRIVMPVHVTDRIIDGVVAMSQGAWYTPDETGADTRGSINVLTSQRPTPLARGNPQHTNLVEIRRKSMHRRS